MRCRCSHPRLRYLEKPSQARGSLTARRCIDGKNIGDLTLEDELTREPLARKKLKEE